MSICVRLCVCERPYNIIITCLSNNTLFSDTIFFEKNRRRNVQFEASQFACFATPAIQITGVSIESYPVMWENLNVESGALFFCYSKKNSHGQTTLQISTNVLNSQWSRSPSFWHSFSHRNSFPISFPQSLSTPFSCLIASALWNPIWTSMIIVNLIPSTSKTLFYSIPMTVSHSILIRPHSPMLLPGSSLN